MKTVGDRVKPVVDATRLIKGFEREARGWFLQRCGTEPFFVGIGFAAMIAMRFGASELEATYNAAGTIEVTRLVIPGNADWVSVAGSTAFPFEFLTASE